MDKCKYKGIYTLTIPLAVVLTLCYTYGPNFLQFFCLSPFLFFSTPPSRPQGFVLLKRTPLEDDWGPGEVIPTYLLSLPL